jgi:small subunit ribosomal protein S6
MKRQVEEVIGTAGAELLVSRLWDDRRLAYPIKGHRKGTYWLTFFRLDGGQIPALNRQCQINEFILRHLFLKVDPRIVDTVISHTKTAKPEPAAGPSRRPQAAPLAEESFAEDEAPPDLEEV